MATNSNPLFDGARKLFLASVGAVATAGEKAGEVLEHFAEKGAETVSQGKNLNHELSRKVSDVTQGTRESLMRARLEMMSADERAEYLDAMQRTAQQIEEEEAARKARKAEEQSSSEAGREKVHITVDEDSVLAAASEDSQAGA